MHRAILIGALGTAAAFTAPSLRPNHFNAPAFQPIASARAPQPIAAGALTTTAWIGGTVATGAMPAFFVVQNLKPWYASLSKPPWNPPDSIFAPVWSTLYALIGLSCARALGNPFASTVSKALLTSYLIQAVLNLSWAPVFFGLHKLRLGFFISTAMLLSAIQMTSAFAAAAGVATACLLIPYLAWLTFATGLNLKLWRLNGPG